MTDMMSRPFIGRAAALLALLSLLAATGVLIHWHVGQGSSAEGVQAAGLPQPGSDEDWMGVYLMGEKIGYSSSRLAPEGEGYRLTERLWMRLKVMGAVKEAETSVEALLDNSLALVSIDSTVAADFKVRLRGNVEGKQLHITLETGGGTQSRTIPIEKAPSFESALMRGIARGGLEVGKRASMPILDPTSMGVSEMTMEVVGRERVVSMGRQVDAYRLKGSLRGVDLAVWVGEDGTVLREETAMGLVLVKEAKEDAMRLDRPSLDIISGLSAPFNLRLPGEAAYLKVRVSGADLRGLELDGGRQRLTGDVLEITREELPLRETGGAGVAAEFLEDTMTVQSRDPEIAAKAEEVVRGAGSGPEKARALYEWVYKNISKENVVSIPSAVEVLRARRGDCNEHTVLYTALARAAGVPTRMAAGLVYRDGAFYYHAWPEVYLGGWVAVDPTLGQFPADASHIRLVTGDLEGQMRLLPLIGRIKLEGLGYR